VEHTTTWVLYHSKPKHTPSVLSILEAFKKFVHGILVVEYSFSLCSIVTSEEGRWAVFQDEAIAKGLSKAHQAELYHDIATAAESGWDFSSRWME
jgi:hypothetical protein